MSREVDLLRAQEAGLELAETYPDAPLVCYPLKSEWEMLHPPVTREPFPAPQRTSRAGLPEGYQAPRAVMQLAQFAREHSWEVRTQLSQGYLPHGSTGRPSALKEAIGVRFGAHPVTDRQAYAVYVRSASGGSWSWSSFMIWGPDLPPYKLTLLDDLKAFLIESPAAPTSAVVRWVADLKAKAAATEEARKRRTRVRAQIVKVASEGRFEAARQETRHAYDLAEQAWKSKVRDLADGVFTLEELERMIEPKRAEGGMR